MRASGVQDLALAVAERDLGRALVLADELLDGGIEAAQIVSQLWNHWIALWAARGRAGRGGGHGAAPSRAWDGVRGVDDAREAQDVPGVRERRAVVPPRRRGHPPRDRGRSDGQRAHLRADGRALACPRRGRSARDEASCGSSGFSSGSTAFPGAAPGGDLVGRLVATILSQHTTDASSDAAYGRLARAGSAPGTRSRRRTAAPSRPRSGPPGWRPSRRGGSRGSSAASGRSGAGSNSAS